MNFKTNKRFEIFFYEIQIINNTKTTKWKYLKTSSKNTLKNYDCFKGCYCCWMLWNHCTWCINANVRNICFHFSKIIFHQVNSQCKLSLNTTERKVKVNMSSMFEKCHFKKTNRKVNAHFIYMILLFSSY
jgi:hypothetical protein